MNTKKRTETKIVKKTGNGLTTEEQHLLVHEGILPLIKDKHPNFKFFTKKQGSADGPVFILLLEIVNQSRETVNVLKSYLINDLGLTINEAEKGGKSHKMKYTITINVSEIPTDSIEIIREGYKKLPGIIKIEKVEESTTSTTPLIFDGDDQKEIHHSEETSTENSKPSLKDLGQKRRSITMALNSLLEFHSIVEENPFSFGVSNDERDQTLHCKNELIAKKAYLLLTWMLVTEENGIIVLWDGSDVSFDISKMNEFYVNKNNNVRFVDAPEDNLTDEVERYFRRVSFGTVPIVRKIKSGVFEIIYVKKATVSKVYSLTKEMGWNVELKDGKLICCIKPNLSKTETEKPSVASVKSVKAILPDFFLNSPEPSLSNNLKLNLNKDQAYEELKSLFEDKHLFSKLSDATKEKVVQNLKNYERERYTEYYANSLLALLK